MHFYAETQMGFIHKMISFVRRLLNPVKELICLCLIPDLAAFTSADLSHMDLYAH